MNYFESNQSERAFRLTLTLACLIGFSTSLTATAQQPLRHHHSKHSQSIAALPKPKPAPARFRGLIGEYGPDNDVVIILEKDAKLCALFKGGSPEPLDELANDRFRFSAPGPHATDYVIFERDRRGRATQMAVGPVPLRRRQIEPESGNQLRIKPVRAVAELMKEALAAQPPKENGDFRETEL